VRQVVLVGSLVLLLVLAPAGAACAQDAPVDPRVAEVVAAAHAQVGVTRFYDPAYRRLDFPGGDVPVERGVCSDVVVRAWRAIGIDLQAELYRDMRAHFAVYPRIWGLTKPDPNIDHRRVPNLETFLRRHGESFPPGRDASAYRAGDLVSWRLERGEPHIGIVSTRRSVDGRRPLIVHNIGAGTQVEDVLFHWPPTGHFRYFPASAASAPSADGVPARSTPDSRRASDA